VPPERSAPKSVPWALTISVPPLLIVAGSAVPPEAAISLPPLATDVSAAVPPAETISVAPVSLKKKERRHTLP
jgi:hypothetical protein